MGYLNTNAQCERTMCVHATVLSPRKGSPMKSMKSMKSIVISILAITCLLSGIQVASAIATTDVIKVCADKTTGLMRYTTKTCKKSETAFTLNKQGLQGATGPMGVQGPIGLTGPVGATGPAGPAGSSSITQLAVCDGTDANSTADEICKEGMTGPGGGTIFFVDYQDVYTGFNYLEAAAIDWGNGIAVGAGENTGTSTLEPRLKWCSDTSTSLGLAVASKRAIGSGASNTATADTTCTSGAVQAASDYVSAIGSKGDWFLPSAGEMQLMATNLLALGVGDLRLDEYSTSSELDATGNLTWWGFYNYGDDNPKTDIRYVRPIRSF